MSTKPSSPLLGSQYLRSLPSTPHVADIQPSTCFNLSRFKEVLRQYRALDDAIINRLNRAHALNAARDRDYAHFDNAECAQMWMSLADNWRGRERMIRFCVGAADPSTSAAAIGDAAAAKATDDEPFAREVLKQQLKNELSVETIVRRRTMNEFLRRCSAYVPPRESVPTEDLGALPAPTREKLQ